MEVHGEKRDRSEIEIGFRPSATAIGLRTETVKLLFKGRLLAGKERNGGVCRRLGPGRDKPSDSVAKIKCRAGYKEDGSMNGCHLSKGSRKCIWRQR